MYVEVRLVGRLQMAALAARQGGCVWHIRPLGGMMRTRSSGVGAAGGRYQPPVQQGFPGKVIAMPCRLLPAQLLGWRMLQGRKAVDPVCAATGTVRQCAGGPQVGLCAVGEF